MLTEKQKDILLNLILQEQRNIHNMNADIQNLLKDYRNELSNIYKAICDTLED